MSIVKKSDVKQLSEKQIEEKIVEIKKDLMKFNAQRAVGTTIENPGKIKVLRRTIAKLLTAKEIIKSNIKEGNDKV